MNKHNVVSNDSFVNILEKPPKEILRLMLQVAQASRNDPANAYIVPFGNIPKEVPTISVQAFGWLFAGEGKCRSKPLPSDGTPAAILAEYIPFIDELSFDGYVLAGSSVMAACMPTSTQFDPSDADFYPHYDPANLTGAIDAEALTMESYIRFLQDFTNVSHTENHKYLQRGYTFRNERCTTIALSEEYVPGHPKPDGCLLSYQIIHRAHSSPRGVVVGFDQIACKAFSDGKDVYLTLDAALALYFGINPVDWRRESPSHMHRVDKYNHYGFTAIFPGLPFSMISGLKIDNEYDSPFYFLPGCKLMTYKTFGREYGKRVAKDYHVRIGFGSFRDGRHMINTPPAKEGFDDDSESDYSLENTEYMAMCYRVVSLLVKGKTELICVFTNEDPVDIIADYKSVNVRTVLDKVMAYDRSEFYFGSSRVADLLGELGGFSVSHCEQPRMKRLNVGQLKRFNEVQNEVNDLFNARATELEALLDPVNERLAEVKFITCNPGRQFTASFNPIERQKPEDYWGSSYQHFEIRIAYDQKWTLLYLRRWCPTVPFYLCDINIMKIIFRSIDRAYVENFMKHEAILPAAMIRPVGISSTIHPISMTSNTHNIQLVSKSQASTTFDTSSEEIFEESADEF